MVRGVHAVVPTAFHDDGSLDVDGVAALVEAYGSAGVDGLVVLGVMGEAPELDRDERARVVRTARAAASGLPVTVGLGRPGPDQLDAAREAASLGADALLAGLSGQSTDRRVALLQDLASTGIDVVAQHHPAATGVQLSAEEVVTTLLEAEVTAVKAEAPPTPDLVEAIVAADGPPALGGLSALYLLEELEAGSAGTMTGLAVPEALVEVVGAYLGGDRAGAQDAYLAACPYLRLESMPGSIGLVVRKEAWRQRGVIRSSRVRRGAPLAAATKRAVTRRLRDAGVDVADPYPDAS